MTSYFDLPLDARADFLEAARYKTGTKKLFLEKDIWLCRVLETLFVMPDAPGMVFKGGTSLSKVYGAIHRFSEDIDITLDHAHFNDGKSLEGLSRNKLEGTLRRISHEAERYVAEGVLPYLSRVMWDARVSISEKDPLSVEVNFDSLAQEERRYISNKIVVEFGIKNTIGPSDNKIVSCDALYEGCAVGLPKARVSVLDPKRTFWEKVTLIHAECHREDVKTPERAARMSRHWYDLAMLLDNSIGSDALKDLSMLESVANYKKRYFRAGWAQYDLASNGNLKLVPEKNLRELLERDYQMMIDSGMFFKDPPTFDSIMDALSIAESDINAKVAQRSDRKFEGAVPTQPLERWTKSAAESSEVSEKQGDEKPDTKHACSACGAIPCICGQVI